MTEYTDWSQMLSITDNWTDQALDHMIKEYKDQLTRQSKIHENAAKHHDFFLRNVNGLEKMKAYRLAAKIKKEYTLKPEHITILKMLYFDYPFTKTNAIIANVKSFNDIAEAIGIVNFDKNGLLHPGDEARIRLLVEELPLALNQILAEYGK